MLTKELYEELRNLSVNFNVEDNNKESFKYIGFCVIEFFPFDERINAFCGNLTNFLSDRDLYKVKEWFYSNDKLYVNNYYRLDFDNYIFIFQSYMYNDEKVLTGNLLKRDFSTRLDLIKHYQEYLQKVFIHGRTGEQTYRR